VANNLDDFLIIRTRFVDRWNLAYPQISFYFDNETPVEPTTSWVRLSIQPGFERRRSIARKTYEQLGRVYLQVFGPPDAVDMDLWPLAHVFADAFRDWQSSDGRIRFDTPTFQFTGAQDDDPAMLLINIPYTAQH